MMQSRFAVLFVVALFVTHGCFDPSFREGIECDPSGGCPPGLSCQADGRCSATLLSPIDAGQDDDDLVTVDAMPPDAGPSCIEDNECDDELFCNGAERCDDSGNCVNGEEPDCADTVACTQDQCNEDTDSCVQSPDHALCDSGASELCNPTEGCIVEECLNDPECNDGIFCNGTEFCDTTAGGGVCRQGTLPTCLDTVACTVDGCNLAQDACANTPDNTACDDGLYCNGPETCEQSTGCQTGVLDINDNIACTTDGCNEATNQITHLAVDSSCNDSLFCNGIETCSGQVGCVAGVAPVVNDNIACTTDACNEISDRVTHTTVNSVCDDGQFCNGIETCNDQIGCVGGVTPVLTDNIACTTDACNEISDRVTHTTVNSACDDGQFCNGTETCSDQVGCVAGVAPVVNDNIACTTDACNEISDRVTHATVDSVCDDGLFCNGAETCSDQVGCQSGSAPVVNDNIACTDDACNEVSDSVTHATIDALCQDNLWCDGAEICNEQIGCIEGATRPVTDNVACTIDSCDEANDEMDHTPINGNCADDGLYCNGDEICDINNGCVSTGSGLISWRLTTAAGVFIDAGDVQIGCNQKRLVLSRTDLCIDRYNFSCQLNADGTLQAFMESAGLNCEDVGAAPVTTGCSSNPFIRCCFN